MWRQDPTFFGRGKCSGWSEYRHGRKKRLTKPRRIITGEKRDVAVQRICDVLRQWTFSRFEHEASTIHGLRIGLIHQGHGWHEADQEAQSLVGESLHLLGYQRPTWEQGQREYVTPREFCNWCGVKVPDDLQSGRRINYCSSVCAESAIKHRDFESNRTTDYALASAYHVVQRSKNPSRPCEQCGKPFRPLFPHGKHCSTECSLQARGGRIENRPCKECGKVFRPSARGRLYCSRECASKSHTFIEERPCAQCGTPFKPATVKSKVQKYCGPTCQAKAAVKHPPRECANCGTLFKPRRADAKTCSSACYHELRRNRMASERLMREFDRSVMIAATDEAYSEHNNRITPSIIDCLIIQAGGTIREAA